MARKRGGDVAPAAMASKSRSMILSPKAPPIPAKNERRASRYDLCNLASGSTLRKSLGERDRSCQRRERMVGRGELVGHCFAGAAVTGDTGLGERVGDELGAEAGSERARIGERLAHLDGGSDRF